MSTWYRTRKDAATVSYEVCGEKVVLHRDPNYVAVRYRSRTMRSDRDSVVENCDKLGTFHDRIEVPREAYTLVPVVDRKRKPGFQTVKLELMQSADVVSVTPVFKLESAYVIATHRLIVGFHPDTKYRRSLLKQHGCRSPQEFENDRVADEHRVEVADPSADPFAVAAELSKLEQVQFVEPELVVVSESPGILSDGDSEVAAVDNRHYLKTTEAEDALAIQKGSPHVRIAILDVGVDSAHPDLNSGFVGAFDAVKNDKFDAVEPVDFHGTACAGLAAGSAASADGVTGIGQGCSLLSVRIACSKNGKVSINQTIVVRAIQHAWKDLKASILSNSWFMPPSQSVANAFARARKEGRKDDSGKALGCVVIAAVGNKNKGVDFPARLTEVLGVSATGPDGLAKKPGSHGGEVWGSNFGPQVDLSAPGVRLLTTDNLGPLGKTSENYNPAFSGTSAATPLVAGAAGLVLSANPRLTEAQVRKILTGPVDVPKGITLPDDRYGAGNLNVLNAVEAARRMQSRFTGVIRQAGTAVPAGSKRAGAYYLEMSNGSSFALRTYSTGAHDRFDRLERNCLARLSMHVDKKVEVTFASRLDRSSGSILWGVRVEKEVS